MILISANGVNKGYCTQATPLLVARMLSGFKSMTVRFINKSIANHFVAENGSIRM